MVVPLSVFIHKVESDTVANKIINREMQGRYKSERFKLLNGIDKKDKLSKGQLIKVLKYNYMFNK